MEIQSDMTCDNEQKPAPSIIENNINSYIDNKTDNLLCIDIGNSRMKIFDGETLLHSISNKGNLEIRLLNILSNMDVDRVIYSSVNAESESVLTDVLYRLKISYSKANELIISYTNIDFSGVQGMGIDRKLGLIAALKQSQSPIITVDFGTCITVNVLDANNKCLGGNIFPGMQTQANALQHFTSALPRVVVQYTQDIIGDNTNDAILSAIINITLNGLNAHINNISKTYFPDREVQIIFTGGISRVSRWFPYTFPFTVDEFLVLKGMWELGKVIS